MFKKIWSLKLKKHKDRNRHAPTRNNTSLFENNDSSLFTRRKKWSIISNAFRNASLKYNQNKAIIIYVLIFLCMVVGVFLFSSVLQVKSIYIYRETSIINIDQAYGNTEYIRWKNILLLDTNEIAQRLLKSQKSISNIEFDTQFPSRLNINIGSYNAIFQTEDYLILSNGVVIPKDSKKYLEIPIIQVSEDIKDYALFWNTLNIESLKNIHTLIEEGKKNVLWFNLKNIRYYIAEKEALLMHESWTIFIFDLGNDILSQIKKLAIFITEKWGISGGKYTYIDFRIPEKLFLCWSEQWDTCRNNIEYIYWASTFDYLLREPSEPQQ